MNAIPKITKEHYIKAWDFPIGASVPTAVDICNRAIEIALAEQQAQQESEFITAAQARELGAGKAEWRHNLYRPNWVICVKGLDYKSEINGVAVEYRAIKKSEPVDAMVLRSDFDFCYQDKQRCIKLIEDVYELVCDNKMSEAKAMLEKRVNNSNVNIPPFIEPVETEEESNASWAAIDAPIPHAALRAEYAKQVAEGATGFYLWEHSNSSKNWIGTHKPDFSDMHYRYTDISCMVSKDGEPAIRMTRDKAQELQRKLGDSVQWSHSDMTIYADESLIFNIKGTYTYRPKQPTWTGSREDVLALLEEKGLICI